MAYVGAFSDKGRVRPQDQDACCFLEANAPQGRVMMAVMCDGVGGLSQGELASTTVVQRFVAWFERDLPGLLAACQTPEVSFVPFQASWDRLLRVANADLFAYGKARSERMGTTFTGMLVIGDRHLIGHVGDCRAYRVSPAGLEQLTADQTLLSRALASGVLSEADIAQLPKRSVILQAVGTQEALEPEYLVGPHDPASVYLLCCDGFYNRLAPDEMLSALVPSAVASEAALRDACVSLAGNAMARGESDNISAVAFTEAPLGRSPSQIPLAHQAFDDPDDAPTQVVSGMLGGATP